MDKDNLKVKNYQLHRDLFLGEIDCCEYKRYSSDSDLTHWKICLLHYDWHHDWIFNKLDAEGCAIYEEETHETGSYRWLLLCVKLHANFGFHLKDEEIDVMWDKVTYWWNHEDRCVSQLLECYTRLLIHWQHEERDFVFNAASSIWEIQGIDDHERRLKLDPYCSLPYIVTRHEMLVRNFEDGTRHQHLDADWVYSEDSASFCGYVTDLDQNYQHWVAYLLLVDGVDGGNIWSIHM